MAQPSSSQIFRRLARVSVEHSTHESTLWASEVIACGSRSALRVFNRPMGSGVRVRPAAFYASADVVPLNYCSLVLWTRASPPSHGDLRCAQLIWRKGPGVKLFYVLLNCYVRFKICSCDFLIGFNTILILLKKHI